MPNDESDLDLLHKNYEKVLGHPIEQEKFKTILAMQAAMEPLKSAAKPASGGRSEDAKRRCARRKMLKNTKIGTSIIKSLSSQTGRALILILSGRRNLRIDPIAENVAIKQKTAGALKAHR